MSKAAAFPKPSSQRAEPMDTTGDQNDLDDQKLNQPLPACRREQWYRLFYQIVGKKPTPGQTWDICVKLRRICSTWLGGHTNAVEGSSVRSFRRVNIISMQTVTANFAKSHEPKRAPGMAGPWQFDHEIFNVQ